MSGQRLPIPPGLRYGDTVTLTVDGRVTTAHLGESLAAILLLDGNLSTRTTSRGDVRGLFCGMGVCFECLVIVDGVPNTRACMTWARDGMHVARQRGAGYPHDGRDDAR